MEITQLRAFLCVAEHRSFSEAANSLFITQPAVSKRINTLEAQLGRQLFDRLGKQIALTPAGRALLPAARRVLVEVANCEAELLSLDGQIAGPLALGTSHHIGLRRLPPLLRHYIHSYPDVQVDLQLSESEDALARVMDNTLELAVITLPTEKPAGVVCEILWPDPLVFCVAAEHPLATADQIDAAALCAHTALLPSRGTATRRLLQEQMQPHGQQLGQILETNYLETNRGLAEAGLGWALLPASMVNDTLCTLSVPDFTLSRDLGVVHRRGRTLSSAANAMLQVLRSKSSTDAL